MIRLRDLVARLRLQFDKAGTQQAEQEARGSLDRIGQAAKRLGVVVAAAFSVRVITRFARGAVDAFQSIQRETRLVRQAVENMGVSWDDADASLKALTDSMWETHRMVGGDVLPVFRTLINVTGDYETSLNAVGVAADMAAALNMDAATAARYLGRILNGETTALTRYGIQLDETRDVLEQLEERFGGAARASVTGGEAIRKAWGEVQEAIGGALTVVFQMEDGQNAIAEALIRVSRWINEQEERWERWSRNLQAFYRWGLKPVIDGLLALGRAILGTAQLITGVFFGVLSAAAHGLALLAEAAALAETAKARFLGLFSKERAEAAERQAEAIRDNAKALREWARAAQQVGRETALAGLGFGPEGAGGTGAGDTPPRTAPPRRTTGGAGTGAAAEGEGAALPTPSVSIADTRPVEMTPTLEQIRTQQMRIRDYADSWLLVNQDILWAAETAAWGVTQAWEDAFDTLFKEGEGFGEFMAALGTGLGAALLEGLSDYAAQKQRAALAEAIQQTALGIGAAAWGNMAQAGAHFKSAATHTAAAMAWAALAGGAASGASAARGGGGGGGVVTGATDTGGAIARRSEVPGPEVTINLIGDFDAMNPRVQRLMWGAMQEAETAYGPGAKINVQRK